MNNDIPNNDDDDMLNYLTDGLMGKQRDLVVRAYYLCFGGDPDSAPVAWAVILAAAARRLALAPTALRNSTMDLKRVLSEARENQCRLMEEASQNMTCWQSSVKDEASRLNATLNEIITQAKDVSGIYKNIRERALTVQSAISDSVRAQGMLKYELQDLKKELTTQGMYSKSVAEATQTIKNMQGENQKLMVHLSSQASIHWLTIGFVAASVIVTAGFSFSPWAGYGLFLIGVWLIQWLGQKVWQYVVKQSEILW